MDQAPQHRAFSGTGRADDRDYIVLIHFKGDLLQHIHVAVRFFKVGNFDYRHIRHSFYSNLNLRSSHLKSAVKASVSTK